MMIDYMSYSKEQLLTRLCEVTEEMAGLYNELGYTRAAEFDLRAKSWMDPRSDSVTARDNDARYAAAVETISIIELDGKLHAYQEEKYLILKLLEFVDGGWRA